MRKLRNYSIETDLIFLEFNDGQNLRVAKNELSEHLTGPDLAKVTRALKLRRDFIRNNFPKTLVVAAIVGLAAFALADSKDVVSFWTRTHPLHPAPSQAGNAAQALSTPTPTDSPVPTPADSSPASAPALPAATPVTAVPAVPRTHVPSSLQNAPLPVKPLEDDLEQTVNTTFSLVRKLGL